MEDFNEVKHTHQTINGKYEVQFEKAPSANKVDGFKVTVHGDSFKNAKAESEMLYIWALAVVEKNKPVPVITEKVK